MIVYQPVRRIDAETIALNSGARRWDAVYPRIRIPNIVRPGLRGMGQVPLPGLSDAGSIPWDDPNGVAGAAQSGAVNIPGVGEVQIDTNDLVGKIVNKVLDWL